MSYKTPILFLVFNRPDTTQIVFNRIKEIKPKYLYVAADGHRDHKPEEADICRKTRDIVLNGVDWDCELKVLFRDTNLGCGKAVSEAISWFFENVEQGIILEDDILPSKTFFRFCEEMLIKYKHNSNIMSIGGSNLIVSQYRSKKSYMFTNYSGNWGWATWRRAWERFDFSINEWENSGVKQNLRKRFKNGQYHFFEFIFTNQLKENDLSVWDYQWWFHRLINNGIGITPAVNLTKNIGFNSEATHTFDMDDEIKNLTLGDLDFPLLHPGKITIDKKYDYKLAKKYYWINKPAKISLIRRIYNKLKRLQ